MELGNLLGDFEEHHDDISINCSPNHENEIAVRYDHDLSGNVNFEIIIQIIYSPPN